MNRNPSPVQAVVPRPVAGPANVFSPKPAGNELAEIAASLRSIAPSLQRYAVQEAERDRQEDTAAGEYAARVLEESRLEYADAVKKGLIEPNDSPWFRYALRRQQGLTSAMQYQRELVAAAMELPEDATLADFETFEREWFDRWKAENIGDIPRDEAFTQGFAAAAAQARQGVALQFAQRANEASLKVFEEGVQQRVNAVLGSLTASSSEEDFSQASELINSIITESVTDNPRFRGRTTALLTDALATAAIKNLNPALFEKVAAGLRSGTGRFDGITSVQARVQEVRQYIAEAEERQIRVEQARTQRKENEAYRSATSRIAALAAEAGRWDLVDIEPVVQELEASGLANVALNVRKYATEYRDSRFDAEAEMTYKDLVYRAATTGLPPAVVAANIGRLKPEWVQNLLALSDATGNTRPYLRRAKQSPMFRYAEEAVRRTFQNSNYPDAGIAQGQTLGALLLSFDEFLKPYEAKGPDVFPTDAEVASWLNANFTAILTENAGVLRNDILKLYQGITGTGQMQVPGAISFPLEYRESISRKFFEGKPFTQTEIGLLRAAFPDIDPLLQRDVLWREFGKAEVQAQRPQAISPTDR